MTLIVFFNLVFGLYVGVPQQIAMLSQENICHPFPFVCLFYRASSRHYFSGFGRSDIVSPSLKGYFSFPFKIYQITSFELPSQDPLDERCAAGVLLEPEILFKNRKHGQVCITVCAFPEK